MTYGQNRGFTLLELLIVIGILAILGTVTVLVLNPAELFRQARDSQRIENIASLRSALGLYTATVTSPDLDGPGSGVFTCAANCFVNSALGAVNCDGRHVGATYASSSRQISGYGWIPVSFSSVPGGTPLASLPIDPINGASGGTNYFFSYACSSANSTFEIDAKMESTKYKSGGDADVESKDGGNSATLYEVGTSPGLSL